MHPLRLFVFFLFAGAAQALAQPLVLTTNVVLADLVAEIGGDFVRVESLVPREAVVQEYEPTDADREKLAEAIFVVHNGAGLEPWLEEFITKSKYEGLLVDATVNVEILDTEGRPYVEGVATLPNEEPPAPDPYAWHDPRNAAKYVEEIRKALASLLPARAPSFKDRATAYTAQLAELHKYAQEQTTPLPRDKRRIVTSHDGLGYFAQSYGFIIVRIPGLASGERLRPAAIEQMVATVTRTRSATVFFEPTANTVSVAAIAGGAGVKANTGIYSRTLGPKDSSAASYVKMFRNNVDAIVSTLK